MKRYLKLLKTILSCRISRDMMYQASFWSGFLVDATFFSIQLITFNTIFGQVESVGPWQKGHMAIFIGSFTILDAVYMGSYFFGVLGIPDSIRTGRLDLYLTKPVDSLFMLSFEKMDILSFLATIPGLVMVISGVIQLNLTITLWQILGYILMLIIMYFLMYCIMILLRIPAFWLIKMTVFNELEGSLVEFSFRIPGILFKGVWKLIFYVFLPYALMATLPTQILTGQLHWSYWMLAIGILIVYWVLIRYLWKMGLRQYNSASS